MSSVGFVFVHTMQFGELATLRMLRTVPTTLDGLHAT